MFFPFHKFILPCLNLKSTGFKRKCFKRVHLSIHYFEFFNVWRPDLQTLKRALFYLKISLGIIAFLIF
ncbi:hypothetical protein COY61_00315 [bacterium (Candidatus Gribaldobacteria) CG_4_10_14_0_8_um_filter_33_9]|uniref:Uncharacterized protein n=1 Tax=bacterium (Candidatus Gribaldobacteria) CG_4_10_14_0_8_um_filter_33_9 TaxID=2014266 RepID=A0A2M7RP15_9BACT|nr:MAG: hypothetical protein COY61_00315 [bacterium (Candidatus Gribaldobacteria) CG_4_10_14_0_8_um_filter_33_9]